VTQAKPQSGTAPLTPSSDEDSADAARLRERLKERLFGGAVDATLEDDSPRPTVGVPEPPLTTLIESLLSNPMDPHRSEAVIARGGMGTIERVHDRRLKRAAAMKIVRTKLGNTPWATRAFISEAQLTAQLDHPNIVPVHSIGQLEDGRLYFTMRHVQGETLRQIIKELPEGPMSRGRLFEILEILVKVCDALALAHSKGVFHCDLKPANIMVGDYGEVYLMDWGISRVTKPGSGEGVTTSVHYEHHSGPFGTAAYMPPEQAAGDPESVDARTDVFGVGTLLYNAITRKHPYPGKGLVAVVRKAVKAEYLPLRDFESAAHIPRELERIILKAMAKRKSDRYQSVTALRDALLAFMHGEQSFPRRSFAAGETIISEGDPGDCAYIIESGSCEVSKIIDGQSQVLRTMVGGEVFGETAVLSEGPRTATVVAREETVVHVVSADAFDDALTSMSPWMSAFVRTLADRFRERESVG
jgi:serine/threonine-protein kinase